MTGRDEDDIRDFIADYKGEEIDLSVLLEALAAPGPEGEAKVGEPTGSKDKADVNTSGLAEDGAPEVVLVDLDGVQMHINILFDDSDTPLDMS